MIKTRLFNEFITNFRNNPHGMRCAAKSKQSGVQCKNHAMPNGKCHIHGGKTGGGAPVGSANALKHGAYGDLIRADDLAHVQAIKDALGGVDGEILMARLQLRRALKAQGHADSLDEGLEVFESTNREGAENAVARSEIKSKRIDYPGIINTLLGRIESLEKSRKELMSKGDGMLTETAKTIICPDEL